MRIALVSDSHDDLPRIAAAIDLLARHNAEAILHAGDITAPSALQPFLDSGLPVMGVFGNTDTAREALQGMCPDLYIGPHTFQIGGRRIVAAHNPADLPLDGDVDLRVYGHLHTAALSRDGALTVSPGEVCSAGERSGSIVIVELDTLDVTFLNLTTGEEVHP
jgi:uncharacterized protein